MEENCRCDNCRELRVRKMIGKLPMEERLTIGDYILKTNHSEFLRGVYITCLLFLLVVCGFIGGLAIFL